MRPSSSRNDPVVRVELGDLGLDRCARAPRRRPPRPRASTASVRVTVKPPSATFATYISGFIVIRCSSRSRRSALSIAYVRAGRPPSNARRPFRISRSRIASLSPAASRPSRRATGRARRSEVGEDQLGVDRRRCRRSVDAPGDVHDVVVDEAAHHVRDRVGLADVREELVAEPSPFDAPGDQPAMSTNSTVVGMIFSGLRDRGRVPRAAVGHRHDADVRVDRAERIVRGRGVLRRVTALNSVDLPTFGSRRCRT